MKYKLALIASFVTVPLSLTLLDGDAEKEFNFVLTCTRLTDQEWRDRVAAVPGEQAAKLKGVLAGLITGWKDQGLVVGEDGRPADFCPESLEAMFQTPGINDVILTGYLKAIGAKAKN